MKKEVKSTEGQCALIAAYSAIQDLLPETPPCAWSAWVKLGRQAEELAAAAKNPCVFDDSLGQKDRVTLCDLLTAKSEGLCGVFSAKPEGGFAGVIGRRGGGMKELTGKLRDELGARGGGTDEMFHGSFTAEREKTESFFERFS